MGDACIGFGDVLASGTISATNVATSAEKLRAGHVSDVFRCTGLSTVISFDAGAAVTARMLFIAGIRQGATGYSTATLAAGTTAGGTDVLGTTDLTALSTYGFDPLYRQAVAVFAADVTARHWSLTLTQTGGSVLEIGRAMLAPILPVSVNLGYPLGLSRLARSQVIEGLGGERTIYRRKDLREAAFGWDGAGITDADAFGTLARTLDATVSTHSPVALVPDRATGSTLLDVRSAIYGYLTELGEASLTSFAVRSKSYRIREAG